MQMRMLGFINTERIRKDFVFASYSIQCTIKDVKHFQIFCPFSIFKARQIVCLRLQSSLFQGILSQSPQSKSLFFHKSNFKCFCALFHEHIN